MTEPKQSFTEEVQMEAEERYKPFYNQSSYDENALRRSTFIEGANVALSILSRKSEGREFYVYSGKYENEQFARSRPLKPGWEPDGFEELHVIENSALVAERAKLAELQEKLYECEICNQKLSAAAEGNGAYVVKPKFVEQLESEIEALKDFELSNKQLVSENGMLNDELTTLRAQLAKLKEQRNKLFNTAYDGCANSDKEEWLEELDLELQKKGQGDE